MALSSDVKTTRYGVGGNAHQPINKPLGASVTVYRGSVAVTDALGNIKNASSLSGSEIVWGLIANAGPGTADTGPGITNGGSSGAVTVEIDTGSFYLANGGNTTTDVLTEANVGQVVYLVNETSVAATNGGSSRPIAGTLLNVDASQPGGFAVKLGSAPPGTGAP